MNNKRFKSRGIVEIKLKRWQVPLLLVAIGGYINSDRSDLSFKYLRENDAKEKSSNFDFVGELTKIMESVLKQTTVNTCRKISLGKLNMKIFIEKEK